MPAREAARILAGLHAEQAPGDKSDLHGEALADLVLWLIERDPGQDASQLAERLRVPLSRIRTALGSARDRQIEALSEESAAWSADEVAAATGMPLQSARRRRPDAAEAGAKAAEQLVDQVEQLLLADPGLTAAAIAQQLGLFLRPAQVAVSEARVRALARVLEQDPMASPEDLALRTGVPLWAAKRLREQAEKRTVQ
jgi:hypothetical protein